MDAKYNVSKTAPVIFGQFKHCSLM